MITANRLEVRAGARLLMENVSFRIATGDRIGLVGRNGAGKTTLTKILAGEGLPASGTVTNSGTLGYLPQEPGLYPGFSAFDLVDYVAVLKEMSDRDTRRDETRRVLDLVGLSDVMHRRIRTLSGGTRHRVALAAALLGSPPLLLMDEPAAGLDPEHRLRLRSMLSDAGTRGTVIVIDSRSFSNRTVRVPNRKPCR